MKTAEEILEEHFSYFHECLDTTIMAMEQYADQFKPKWVSVEERLPETDGELSDDVLISGRIFLYGEYSHIGTTIGWIDEKGTWGNIIPEKQKVFVTHWMPLPEPPKTV